MGWQGASWLEREKRQHEERGDLQTVNLPDTSIDLAIRINMYHEL